MQCLEPSRGRLTTPPTCPVNNATYVPACTVSVAVAVSVAVSVAPSESVAISESVAAPRHRRVDTALIRVAEGGLRGRSGGGSRLALARAIGPATRVSAALDRAAAAEMHDGSIAFVVPRVSCPLRELRAVTLEPPPARPLRGAQGVLGAGTCALTSSPRSTNA
jgi:hypothetical protein